MKKLLAVLSVAALLTPAFAFAAAGDVSMTTNAKFDVGGVELDVYASSATIQSAVVSDAPDLTLTLAPGSSITIMSPGKNVISESGGSSYVTINECDNNSSQIGFSYPSGSGSAAPIVISVSSTNLCAGGNGGGGGGGSSSSSSGGGGGGGGSVSTTVTVTTPVTTTTPTTTTAPTVVSPAPATPSSGLSSSQVQSILDVLASFSVDASTMASVKAALEGTSTGSVTSAAVHAFKLDLTVGSLGSEVKTLQQFLNAHGYTIATTGAGSVGNETTKFGPATKAALIKFQKANNITPASGYFGAKTRAVLNSGN